MLRLFNKINLKFILNPQIDIFILINYNCVKGGRITINKNCRVVKEIINVIKVNEDKMVK